MAPWESSNSFFSDMVSNACSMPSDTCDNTTTTTLSRCVPPVGTRAPYLRFTAVHIKRHVEALVDFFVLFNGHVAKLFPQLERLFVARFHARKVSTCLDTHIHDTTQLREKKGWETHIVSIQRNLIILEWCGVYLIIDGGTFFFRLLIDLDVHLVQVANRVFFELGARAKHRKADRQQTVLFAPITQIIVANHLQHRAHIHNNSVQFKTSQT